MSRETLASLSVHTVRKLVRLTDKKVSIFGKTTAKNGRTQLKKGDLIDNLMVYINERTNQAEAFIACRQEVSQRINFQDDTASCEQKEATSYLDKKIDRQIRLINILMSSIFYERFLNISSSSS